MATTLETVGFGIVTLLSMAFGIIINSLTKRVEKLENCKLEKTEYQDDLKLKLENVTLQYAATLEIKFNHLEKTISEKMKPIEDAILLMKSNIKKRENDI